MWTFHYIQFNMSSDKTLRKWQQGNGGASEIRIKNKFISTILHAQDNLFLHLHLHQKTNKIIMAAKYEEERKLCLQERN